MKLETLVARFKEKDVKAFEQLYHMYAPNICGVIQTIVQDHALAQEICQDVFVKVWRHAESYDASKGRFFTWVLNIARNAAIDETRSKSFKTNKKNLSVSYFVGILDQPENTNDSNKAIISIKKIVGSLKQKCIEIIDLLYFKGYTQKEVSEELDIPIGTVKTRNRNCISQLRRIMKV